MRFITGVTRQLILIDHPPLRGMISRFSLAFIALLLNLIPGSANVGVTPLGAQRPPFVSGRYFATKGGPLDDIERQTLFRNSQRLPIQKLASFNAMEQP